MSIHLDTVYAAIQIVPAVIGIAQGKDSTTKAFAGSLIAVAAWLGLHRDVGFIRDATNGTLYQVLALAGAVLGVVVAVRFKERIAATLIITASALLALHALQVVGD
jgi:hypothetical protein